MKTMGIDPGLSGAISFVEDDNYAVFDLPVIRDGKLSWIDGGVLQSLIIEQGVLNTECYIERVQAMPKQGLSSSFNFGVGFGSILSVIQTLRIPLHFVTPQSWKRALILDREKNTALDKARLLFPMAELHLKKHDGRAEALLIAHFARTIARTQAAA